MGEPAMRHDNPPSTAKIFGHPIHPMLVPLPIASFIGAWITDIVYWRTADMQWANFSVWLLTAGLIFGGLAAVAGMVDYFASDRVRSIRGAKHHMWGNIVVMVLSLINVFIHSRDAYTSVVPTGLILSTIVVAILGVTAWLGGELVYRHGVGVAG